MMAALDRGWRQAPGLKRVTVETRDLFRRPLEPDELRKTEAVVIDPPRAGAEAQTRALARAAVPVVAFVSCNPVTFARDALILVRGGYRLDWCRSSTSSAGRRMSSLPRASAAPSDPGLFAPN